MLPFQLAFALETDSGVRVVDHTWIKEPRTGNPKIPVYKRLGRLLVVFSLKTKCGHNVAKRRPAGKSCGKAVRQKQARKKVKVRALKKKRVQ